MIIFPPDCLVQQHRNLIHSRWHPFSQQPLSRWRWSLAMAFSVLLHSNLRFAIDRHLSGESSWRYYVAENKHNDGEKISTLKWKSTSHSLRFSPAATDDWITQRRREQNKQWFNRPGVKRKVFSIFSRLRSRLNFVFELLLPFLEEKRRWKKSAIIMQCLV